MNLVIDPNVFLATAAHDKCGETCGHALEKLYNPSCDLENMRIVIDHLDAAREIQ